MRKHILSQAIVLALGGALLTGCGGGSSAPSASTTDTTISGAVVDAAVQGAIVCLYADGQAVMNGTAPVCSAATDTNGNYTLTIPGGLVDDAKRLTLVATKAGGIKLVSSIGTMAEVKAKAGSDNTVTTGELPQAQVTHFTTAEFATKDTDNDGDVSDDEEDAYTLNPEQIQQLAALIKAVVDYGTQYGYLLSDESVEDTLELIEKVLKDGMIGSIDLDDWYTDSNNSDVVSDVEDDLDAGYIQSYLTGATFVKADSIGTVIFRFNADGTVNEWGNDYNDNEAPRSLTHAWSIKDDNTLAIGDEDIQIMGIDGNAVTTYIPSENATETIYRTVPFTNDMLAGKSFTVNRTKRIDFNANGTAVVTVTSTNNNFQDQAFWSIEQDQGFWSIENGSLKLVEQANAAEYAYIHLYEVQQDGKLLVAWRKYSPTWYNVGAWTVTPAQ
ncbi:MAG: hypothetical protein AB1713_07740 [Pseudomonadota bacterium]